MLRCYTNELWASGEGSGPFVELQDLTNISTHAIVIEQQTLTDWLRRKQW